MKDDNWDLISGPDAHDIEILNYANQVNVIEALFKLLMHHHKGSSTSCDTFPSQRALSEFHRTGTLFLLHDPGSYRTTEVVVATNTGVVVYQPPVAADVIRHMDEFDEELKEKWGKRSPIHIASFCLWKLNWIHPFKNGNGRTVRAFCYACICLSYGFILPGSPTIIDLIMANRGPYRDALQAADLAFSTTSAPDLTLMEAYLEDLLTQQLSSIS